MDFTNRTRSDARINHYDRVAATRPNYHILADTTVSKIIFDNTTAVGVVYVPTAGGSSTQVYANKEVLIAAGAVSTPKLLQLSGVGPSSLLDDLDIDIMADLPGVGANLQDQPNGAVVYTFENNTTPNADTASTNTTYLAEQEALYFAKREGAWTITAGFGETVALVSLCDATSDCEDLIAAASEADPSAFLPEGTDATVLAGYTRQREQILSQYAGDNVPVAMLHWTTGSYAIVFLLRPLSRGLVQIQSTDILESPLVDWRAMTDPVDVKVAVAAFLKNRQVMQAPSMAVLGPNETAPFGYNITDGAQLGSIITSAFGPTTGHLCCTAAMLPLDEGGVVDTEWKVYGLAGLRVIDISTWPMVTAVTPMATVYAAAEQVADVIKKAYCLDNICS